MREVLAFCGATLSAVGLKAKGKRLWAGLFFYDVAHTRDLDSRFRGRGLGFAWAFTASDVRNAIITLARCLLCGREWNFRPICYLLCVVDIDKTFKRKHLNDIHLRHMAKNRQQRNQIHWNSV